MMIAFFLIIFGFFLLIKGADLLVDGGGALAKKMKISEMVIGLTVISFGTSLPELIVSVLAAWNESNEIALGNVIGSNIANVLLILGIAAMILPLNVKINTIFRELPLSILASLVLFVLINDVWIDGEAAMILSRADGLILLAFFAIFLAYILAMVYADRAVISEEVEGVEKMSTWKALVYALLGVGGLAFGGGMVVDNAVILAELLGMSETVIGLTVVAIGTSLPELAASAMAAWKGNADMAVGNVIGSNIFNICWVLGVSVVISDIAVEEATSLTVMMVILVSLLTFSFMHIGKKHVLQRWQGGLFLAMYLVFLIQSLV